MHFRSSPELSDTARQAVLVLPWRCFHSPCSTTSLAAMPAPCQPVEGLSLLPLLQRQRQPRPRLQQPQPVLDLTPGVCLVQHRERLRRAAACSKRRMHGAVRRGVRHSCFLA